jgi:hypothetical protein
MMLIRLVGRRMEAEVALKVRIYLNSYRRNQILSGRLPFFTIPPALLRFINHKRLQTRYFFFHLITISVTELLSFTSFDIPTERARDAI